MKNLIRYKLLDRALLISLAMTVLTSVSASNISQTSFTPNCVYVFGDSLSDVGSNTKLDKNNNNKRAYYTQPGGQNWTRYFINRLSPELKISAYSDTNIDGNSYAQGGATTSGVGIAQPTGIAKVKFHPLSVNKQINIYFRVHSKMADPKSLYIIFAGANNIFEALSSKNPTVSLPLAVKTATQDISNDIVTLKSAGAKHIFVLEMPDLGKTPFAISINKSSLLSGISYKFNKILEHALKGQAGVVIFNTYQFMNNVIYNRGMNIDDTNYSFQYTEQPACNTNALTCSKPVVGHDFNSYIFAGPVHPTDKMNHLLGLAAAKCILSSDSTSAACSQRP